MVNAVKEEKNEGRNKRGKRRTIITAWTGESCRKGRNKWSKSRILTVEMKKESRNAGSRIRKSREK